MKINYLNVEGEKENENLLKFKIKIESNESEKRVRESILSNEQQLILLFNPNKWVMIQSSRAGALTQL